MGSVLIPGALINASVLRVLPVYGGERPLCEGPRILPLLGLSFATIERYDLDFSSQMKQGRISLIQSVFVDASNLGPGTGPINIFVPLTGHRLLINNQTQGFFPLLAMDPFNVVIECHSGGRADVIFCNFMIPSSNWPSQPI